MAEQHLRKTARTDGTYITMSEEQFKKLVERAVTANSTDIAVAVIKAGLAGGASIDKKEQERDQEMDPYVEQVPQHLNLDLEDRERKEMRQLQYPRTKKQIQVQVPSHLNLELDLDLEDWERVEEVRLVQHLRQKRQSQM